MLDASSRGEVGLHVEHLYKLAFRGDGRIERPDDIEEAEE